MLKARITFRHNTCYSQSLTGKATAAQITRDAESDVYVMQGADEAEVEEYIQHMIPVFGDSLQVIDRTATSVLYRGKNPPHATVSAVLAAGCSVLWPVVFGENRQLLTVVAPDRARLEALLHELSRLGTPTVHQVTGLPPEALSTNVALADLVGGLTDRQIAIINYAVEHGYYETPRAISIDDIADHFGVGRSTVDEHLRKAERAVLNKFHTVFAAFNSNLPGSTKKRGRPPAWMPK